MNPLFKFLISFVRCSQAPDVVNKDLFKRANQKFIFNDPVHLLNSFDAHFGNSVW